jgi:hypothetical protein
VNVNINTSLVPFLPSLSRFLKPNDALFMLVKYHGHLHPLVRSKWNYVDQNIFYQDYNLDIFEQIANELADEFIKRGILIFRRYQLDVKDIKCPLQWY